MMLFSSLVGLGEDLSRWLEGKHQRVPSGPLPLIPSLQRWTVGPACGSPVVIWWMLLVI